MGVVPEPRICAISPTSTSTSVKGHSHQVADATGAKPLADLLEASGAGERPTFAVDEGCTFGDRMATELERDVVMLLEQQGALLVPHLHAVGDTRGAADWTGGSPRRPHGSQSNRAALPIPSGGYRERATPLGGEHLAAHGLHLGRAPAGQGYACRYERDDAHRKPGARAVGDRSRRRAQDDARERETDAEGSAHTSPTQRTVAPLGVLERVEGRRVAQVDQVSTPAGTAKVLVGVEVAAGVTQEEAREQLPLAVEPTVRAGGV